jgi:hypothetical protein
LLVIVGCVALLAAPPPGGAAGEYDAAPGQAPVWLRALLDVRFADLGSAPAWPNRGPGKVRYGGRFAEGRFDHVNRLRVSQLAVELGGTLPWGLMPRAQLNWNTDIDGSDLPLVVEAYVRREWGRFEHGLGLQSGVLNAPFSLEHTGPAYTPAHTLSASALNTWLWEEVRTIGGEIEWWRSLPSGFRLDVLGGFGFGPDEIGWLLAERGWVMSDFVTGINTELPIPRDHVETSVFDERDWVPAGYVMVKIGDPLRLGDLKVGHFDNSGDQGQRGTWDTRFTTVGVAVHPCGKVDLIAQYLSGDIHTRVAPWDTQIQAYFVLGSVRHRGHRVSLRYDEFRAHDLDGGPRFSGERGDAVTLAYLFEFGLHHRVGVEFIWPDSDRPQFFAGDPPDDGWQVSYRFRY